MIAAFIVGLVLGYPALRVQGHYLAFVTLAFNTLVFLILRNEDWLTGGTYGLTGMPRPKFTLFGVGLHPCFSARSMGHCALTLGARVQSLA